MKMLPKSPSRRRCQINKRHGPVFSGMLPPSQSPRAPAFGQNGALRLAKSLARLHVRAHAHGTRAPSVKALGYLNSKSPKTPWKNGKN